MYTIEWGGGVSLFVVGFFFLVLKINRTIYEHCQTDTLPPFPYVVQAWAFASGARWVLGQTILMNMEDYPCSVWYMHRKIFHRFLKYSKYFVKASDSMPELSQLEQKEKDENKDKKDKPTPSVENDHHVISLLSDSDVLSDSDETDVEAEVDALFNSDDGEATV